LINDPVPNKKALELQTIIKKWDDPSIISKCFEDVPDIEEA